LSSVTVIIGSELGRIPVQVTTPPILILGLHVSQPILVVAPVSIPLQVIITFPLVGFGFAVHVGTIGAVVSISIESPGDCPLSPQSPDSVYVTI
jgi:hypothetical protein